jgi:hypothetical protein
MGHEDDAMHRISPSDRDTLRQLAARWRAICDGEHAAWSRRQWQRLVDLEPTDRPLVAVMPEGATAELMAGEACTCDPRLHYIEWPLRERLRRAEFLRDDTPWVPTIDVGWRVSDTGWGVEIPQHHGENRGSFVWEPPLKDLSKDLAKLSHRRWSVDRAASDEDLALAEAAVGDLLTVQRRHYGFWTVGLTIDVIRLVGLEQLMTLMYDDPDGLHALMAWMRDDTAQMMDWYEAEGLLTSNHDAGFGIGSGAYGPTASLPASAGGASFAQRWGFAESQETVGVSPKLFQQFILPYQVPLMNRFALVYYGCCEGVERRLQMVMDAVPRLRVVSMAPWADQQAMARISAGRLVLARKPNPTLVCGEFRDDAIRSDLAETLRLAGHRPLCFVLKDTHTVQNEPQRLASWVELAREEVDRFCCAGAR